MPPPEVHLTLTAPSPWIMRFADLIRPGGRVLDVACGGGRHARWLLDRGFDLTLVDRDTEYVADLSDRARIVTADLEDGIPWPFGGETFEAVVVTNYLYRPLLPHIVAAVADPGGVLLYQTFMVGNEHFARPRNPDHLLQPGELLDMAADGLQVVAFEQGVGPIAGRDRKGVMQSLCAVRSDAPVALPAVDPGAEAVPQA